MPTFPDFLTVIELDTVDSTNRFLKDRLDPLEPNLPVLAYARAQSAGRGRAERGWFSAAGMGVYASFALRLAAARLPWLPLACGLAVIDTLAALGVRGLTLKWPNDVLWRDRKLAGVLCESRVQGEQARAVCGLGVNLNHRSVDFPPELRGHAVSLAMLGGEPLAPRDALVRLAGHLFTRLEGLAAGETEALAAAADRAAAPLRHRPISFHAGRDHRLVRGLFAGITAAGGVALEDEAGGRTEHFPAEISLI